MYKMSYKDFSMPCILCTMYEYIHIMVTACQQIWQYLPKKDFTCVLKRWLSSWFYQHVFSNFRCFSWSHVRRRCSNFRKL